MKNFGQLSEVEDKERVDTDSARAQDLVNEYSQALEQLADEKVELPARVFRALMTRDRLGKKLGSDPPADVADLQQIAELDEKLRRKAKGVRRSLDPAIFERWRKVLLPGDSAWWWHLDNELSPSPLWMVIAALLFTASLTLFWDNSSKLMSVRPDLAVAGTTISQGLLAILTGSTFTEVGRRWIGTILSRLGIAPRQHHIWLTALAGLTLLVTISISISIKPLARFYWKNANDIAAALKNQGNGKIDEAINTYQRALALDPDLAQARYNLATAYEDLQDTESAIREYRLAIKTDPEIIAAYNNLARRAKITVPLSNY